MNPLTQPLTVESLKLLEGGAKQGNMLYNFFLADDKVGAEDGDQFIMGLINLAIDVNSSSHVAASCSVLASSLYIQGKNELALEFAEKAMEADPTLQASTLAVAVTAGVLSGFPGESILESVAKAHDTLEANAAN